MPEWISAHICMCLCACGAQRWQWISLSFCRQPWDTWLVYGAGIWTLVLKNVQQVLLTIESSIHLDILYSDIFFNGFNCSFYLSLSKNSSSSSLLSLSSFFSLCQEAKQEPFCFYFFPDAFSRGLHYPTTKYFIVGHCPKLTAHSPKRKVPSCPEGLIWHIVTVLRHKGHPVAETSDPLDGASGPWKMIIRWVSSLEISSLFISLLFFSLWNVGKCIIVDNCWGEEEAGDVEEAQGTYKGQEGQTVARVTSSTHRVMTAAASCSLGKRLHWWSW